MALAVFCAGLLLPATIAFAAGHPDPRDVQVAGNVVRTRVVMNFDSEPDPKWFLPRDPHRLVIDLPDTRFLFDGRKLKSGGLVRNLRYGAYAGAPPAS